MKRYCAISLLAFICIEAKSQTIFVMGTIFTKDGNTIDCLIEDDNNFYEGAKYKMTTDGKVSSMRVGKIKSVQMPFNFFENIRVGNKERLMRLLTRGKISLYRYEDRLLQTPGDHTPYYEMPYYDNEMHHYDNTTYKYVYKYVTKKYGVLMEYDRDLFDINIRQLIGDCPALLSKITNDGYQYDDIWSIVNEYNISSCDEIVPSTEYLSLETEPEYTMLKIGDTKNGTSWAPPGHPFVLTVNQYPGLQDSLISQLEKLKVTLDSGATLSVLEEVTDEENPYVFFKLDKAGRDKTNSMLCYILEGKSNEFVLLVETKSALFTDEFIAKWIHILKRSTVIERSALAEQGTEN